MDDKGKKAPSKKVDADGLTKKERRALKVGVEKNVETNNTQLNATIKKKLSNEKIVPSLLPQSQSKKNINEHNLKPQPSSNSGSETVKLNVTCQDKKQPEVQPNQNLKTETEKVLTKAELRAQRRALQETQRLAKANQNLKPDDKQNVEVKAKPKATPTETKIIKKIYIKKPAKKLPILHKVQLFNHLYLESPAILNLNDYPFYKPGVHPAFLQLGAQYLSKSILGSNARCLAMLSALKCLIHDYKTPPKQEFCRSLESTLQTCMTHLNNCRPLAVSMTNALRFFKLYLTQMNETDSDSMKRNLLQDRVDSYIQEQIGKAGESISHEVNKKISDDDIILIYGYSSLIQKILIDAHKHTKKFRVIVLDSRPLLEGREMLRRLVCANIQCSYLLINAVSFVMSRVTKVLLGAHALLANGYVMSRTGTAQVALVANAYKKPVLVCCETYKFCERAQTDSFVSNELADPDQLIKVEALPETKYLLNWRNNKYLTPLNIMYDVTPSDFVTAVVTEIAVLPCTSVPVILRIKPVE